MRYFKEEFVPEKVTIENHEGKEFIIESKMQTSDVTKEIELTLSDSSMIETDKVHKIMSLLFDKPQSFWGQFSHNLLKRVSDDVQSNKKKLTKEQDTRTD